LAKILGISAYYHDSAAALIDDGRVLAAAQEERFTRKKQDADFPARAVEYVLEETGFALADIDYVAFYDKPYLKFERLLETYHAMAPKGYRSFLAAIPVWIKEKMFMRRNLKKELSAFGAKIPELMFPEHHLSHAASAFYPSPFEDAAILTVDGVGEWATTTIGHGKGNQITIAKELHFPHSLGLLYAAFTGYCGFKVNSGEYKLMGLAPYGVKGSDRVKKWKDAIYKELADVRPDGSLLLNQDYFEYATGLKMFNTPKWRTLFGVPPREQESEISQEYMDLALAIQEVTEEVILKMAETAKEVTGSKNLVMAGGVALNCSANGVLLRRNIFDDIWIQPASGDAGGALGAALAVHYIVLGNGRKVDGDTDSMQGAYLGPEYGQDDINRIIKRNKAPAKTFGKFEDLADTVADLIAEGNVVGWFQGRMEFGPRALGNRSILGDPRNPEMQKRLNLKIKYREGFRPFAPSVLARDIHKYFDIKGDSPYMLLVAPVADELLNKLPDNYDSLPLYERLYFIRSALPAITHVDYSARIQSVTAGTNPRYAGLIEAFKRRHDCSVIVNTSFNVRGEPIVCTPDDAYRCFMRTEMDYLVVGDTLFTKTEQPAFVEKGDWRNEFALD
jgi:Predicted carbamoyl transferase, NodU family